MDINQKITEELGVKKWQVDAAVRLIDEGNTIPFIARYRKEATGTLDDEQLRKLYERLNYLRGLEEKKEQVLSSIEEQGKLTPELKQQILAAETLVVVEDLYRPYRPPLPRKRGWSLWQRPLPGRRWQSRWKRRRSSMSVKKKEWPLWKRPLQEPGILSRNSFPIKQTTAASSGM